MNWIIKVTYVNSPHGYANDRYYFGQLLTEFVQLLLQRSLHLLGLAHFVSYLAYLSITARAYDNASTLASGYIRAREKNVLLILVDRSRVGYGIGVLDHRYGLARQQGLVNAKSCRED